MRLKTTMATVAMGLAMSTGIAVAEYPEKPVQFIVPWPPGDLEDIMTRKIAEDFSAEYGVPAAVINKPGGGGGPFPGAIDVATAPADGYTIGSFVLDVPLVGPMIGIPELSPDPFEPLGIFITYPFVIAARGDAPFSTMEELATYAQDNKVVLAHFGPQATPTQVTFAMANKMGFSYGADSGFDAVDCNTFASGDVDVANTTLALILPCLDDLKILTSLTEERIPLTPDAPTVYELVPEVAMVTWNGLFVHKDTPADVRAKISAVAEKTVNSQFAKDLAEQTGGFFYWKDAEASQAVIDADMKTLEAVAAAMGQ